jgi:hypothetical protein
MLTGVSSRPAASAAAIRLARELRLLLDDLGAHSARDVDPVDTMHARVVLKRAGFGLIEPDGHLLSLPTVASPLRAPDIATGDDAA